VLEEIVNKVAASGLVTFNLEDYYVQGERIELDIKDHLYEGLILREKDFREFVKNHDWAQYSNHYVAISCSTDAIVPTWAYMLLATKLQPFAKQVFFGNKEAMESALYYEKLSKVNLDEYRDQRVVIKGCSNLPVPVSAYVEVTRILTPIVKSIMYGEPCSTVPLYKKAKE
jgi:hypothetical protein